LDDEIRKILISKICQSKKQNSNKKKGDHILQEKKILKRMRLLKIKFKNLSQIK
jgi:hypothetical protein